MESKFRGGNIFGKMKNYFPAFSTPVVVTTTDAILQERSKNMKIRQILNFKFSYDHATYVKNTMKRLSRYL